MRALISVSRRGLVKYLEENRFRNIREGGNHTIYSSGIKVITVNKHRQFDRFGLPDKITPYKSSSRQLIPNYLGCRLILVIVPNWHL